MILLIVACVSALLNVVLVFVALRLSRKLLQFDELFDMLSDDVQTNVEYFKKLLATPLLNNSPEVISMQKNIDLIGRRLQEYALRMNETTNKDVPESE